MNEKELLEKIGTRYPITASEIENLLKLIGPVTLVSNVASLAIKGKEKVLFRLEPPIKDKPPKICICAAEGRKSRLIENEQMLREFKFVVTKTSDWEKGINEDTPESFYKEFAEFVLGKKE